MNVVSIQIGLPREVVPPDATDATAQPWITGIFKEPIPGPVWVHREHLEGDGQAATAYHGGPDRAVLGYAASHYDAFRREFPGFALPYGAFGENLTIAGLSEDTVCLGDKVQIGETLLEVSVPRTPCDAISRRCKIPDMLDRVKATGRIGWFYRVLQEGNVAAGAAIHLLERPYPRWSIAHMFALVTRLKQDDKHVLPAVREMVECPALASAWREVWAQRCEKLENRDR